MCGLLFVSDPSTFSRAQVAQAMDAQAWRGPDASTSIRVGNDVWLGHARLTIIEPSPRANQPLFSHCGRYAISYNGEIYNHLELRRRFGLRCSTASDTETLIEGFSKHGTEFFDHLRGMFAFVIVSTDGREWWSARDRFGIKPLYWYATGSTHILASESIAIRRLVPTTVSRDSVKEWTALRRPIPGFTFFHEIREVLPGQVLHDGHVERTIGLDVGIDVDQLDACDDEQLLSMLRASVQSHELADTQVVALLSGGLDSAVVAALSNVTRTYTIGLPENNEFEGSDESARALGRELIRVTVDPERLRQAWIHLIELRDEPLAVPNEGLIYLVASAMHADEKVFLTGEGADETFCGYDRIFRRALSAPMSMGEFLHMYAYSANTCPTERMKEYLASLWNDDAPFASASRVFMELHLPGLLRRMDSAAMAASKEARVPFLGEELVAAVRRVPERMKIDANASKLPLRRIATRLGLHGALTRKKIGFSSRVDAHDSRLQEYAAFQAMNLEVLGWS